MCCKEKVAQSLVQGNIFLYDTGYNYGTEDFQMTSLTYLRNTHKWEENMVEKNSIFPLTNRGFCHQNCICNRGMFNIMTRESY